MSKYRNIRTVYNGITFDSAKECQRYIILKKLEDSGYIKNLELQKKFVICPKSGANKRTRYYIADFVYVLNGKKVIEDVKSPITRTNPVYSLKKALIQWQYPEYEFDET